MCSGEPQTPRFKNGDEVCVQSQRDAIGVVVGEARLLGGEYWYPVRFGIRRANYPESNLELFTGFANVPSLFREGRYGPRESLSKIVTFTKLKKPLKNNLYAYRAARIQFHEYQFKPLLKVLASPDQRLLIADEVGLGKTIEAGLIYQELHARHELERVLIVCPSTLRLKWQEEMARRFSVEFHILDAAELRTFLRKLSGQGRSVHLRGICSLQTIRSESMIEQIEAVAPPLDLVIVDEAHHMRNSGTLSNRIGRVLSESAEAMLLLTATPVHLGNENLFQLMHILDPDEFDNALLFDELLRSNRPLIEADRILRQGKPVDLAACRDALMRVETGAARDRFLQSPVYRDLLRKIGTYSGESWDQVVEIQGDLAQLNLLGHVLSRTRKREVSLRQPKRQAEVMRLDWTAPEQQCYEKVTEYCRDRIGHAGGASPASWFPVISLQRQMASSLPAMLEYYADPTAGDSSEEMSDVGWESLTENGESAEAVSLRDDPKLQAIWRGSRQTIKRDSKLDALLLQLKHLDKAEPGRKILLFSYFKKTLGYLFKKLSKAGYSCLLITGDVPSKPVDPDNDERGKRLRQFRKDPSVRIMLSSEVGSEGLDFEFAHILVNYDLPWNPMVVEQRIGRLDRMGQKSDRILIYNFAIRGTIEDRVLARLYARIRIFEESIGDLEAILGTEIRELTLDLLRSKLTPEEEERRIEECAKVLEQKRQALRVLEQRASEFIGHDQFFQTQLDEIRSKRRFVTPDELETLVTDFLRREFPSSVWEPADPQGCFRFKPATALATLIKNEAGADMDELFILDRARRSSLLVTFRDDVALEHEEVELLNARHVVIRTIIRYYEQHEDRLHPVAAVQVAYREVPQGDYGYVLYLVEQQCANPGVTLEAIFLPLSGGDPLKPGDAEMLLSEVVTRGQSLDDGPPLTPDQADDLLEKADHLLGERIESRREDLRRINADIVSRRMASLEASYKTKRAKKVELLERARNREAREQYVRMLEGTIRNMDTAYEDKGANIEAGREVHLHFNILGAGIARVGST